MGIFWDLIQQSQIDEQKEKSDTLESRVKHLEDELQETRDLLKKTLYALEEHLGEDIDGSGTIGAD